MAENSVTKGLSEDVYRAYFGLHAEYYSEKLKIFVRTNFKASWNWSAFLFPAPCLFYRKVWAYGFIVLVISPP